MTTFKRTGLLPFYKDDQPQDWELSGYFDEFINAIQFVPRDVLVSFRTPFINAVLDVEPTQITIRKLSFGGETKTIISSDDYTVTINIQYADVNLKNCEEADAIYTYYYFNQSTISEDANEYLIVGCIYEIYLVDASGNSYISNIFVAIDETKIFINAEDGQIILDESGEGILFE